MITSLGPTFLRPRFLVADAVRALTLVSLVVAVIGWGGTSFAVMSLCLLGVVVPRMLGLRPAFDVLVCVLVLVSGWSSVLEWYTTVFLWDKVVHVLLTGVLAAVAYVIGSDVGAVSTVERARQPIAVVLATVAGFAIGAVWEIGEWAGHTYVDSAVAVGYLDTIGDLAADGLGGLLAGFALPWLAARREVVRPGGR
ncbi:putative membrane protein YqgA involved in biofilm formation [Curtobacterium pusillum]|uniref:Membrane protein YqgA involved in biofilm formation n=1 Tax=Curtobacterium pusillum TaxID=69373 RepID=A0AAW3TB53_9MICO|nr:hypothetical protein [Curtobacterium pusillum]MBA8991542.1 putative membrane protein YqgA involved in biofilm formation [Curtobacterium pusillum]